MKNNPEENNDLLDRSMREWRVNAPLPPWFQGQVWRRIADAAEGEKARLWAVLQDWFQFAFSRPAVALAYVLVLLFIGSGAGYWQAREKSARIDHSLGSRYVRSVDPYQETGK
jgi:hypothetical protein